MIDKVLECLQLRVHEHLSRALPADGQPKVELVKYEGESIKLAEGAVSLLLLNLEEERTLRPADPYSRSSGDGGHVRTPPELRLIVYILFVARFSEHYLTAWRHLSHVLELFQATRVLDSNSASGLPEGIEKMVFELVTLTLAEQNEVWSTLRAAHHPALLYRVKLLAYRHRGVSVEGPITEVQTVVRRAQ